MSNLEQVIDKAKQYKHVLVTGPQRSGTTIASHIISEECGYLHLDETAFGIHDYIRAVNLFTDGYTVMQAPGLCHIAHWFNHADMLVVMMRRSLDAIAKSEERIGWRTAYDGLNLRVEQDKYQAMYGINDSNIAWVKYFCWDNLQKQHCNNIDLEYTALKSHKLYQSERSNFGDRQWKLS